MLVLVFMWCATLLIIYFTTYTRVNSENREMMQIYASAYDSHGLPKDDAPDFDMGAQTEKVMDEMPPEMNPPDADDELTHRYEVSTFFAVIFDSEGAVKEFINQSTSEMTDEELTEWASVLVQGSKKYGISGNIVYLITTGDGYTMVTMMDNSVTGAAISALLHYMLLLGGISIVILLILSALLANWVVKPLEEAYEKQKIFIADAGHELKTPISTISANLEILQRESGGNKWIYNISYENERMSQIVHQLLDLAELENTNMVLADVDFSRTAMSAILPFEAKAFEENILLDYEIEDKLIVKGDARQLEKLVSILLDNAISHSNLKSSEKVVKVSATKINGGTEFVVSNRGDEIAPKDREKIFERFYKEDKSRTENQGHYGLGLAIAKAIVIGCGGRIWVECNDGWVSFHVIFTNP